MLVTVDLRAVSEREKSVEGVCGGGNGIEGEQGRENAAATREPYLGGSVRIGNVWMVLTRRSEEE